MLTDVKDEELLNKEEMQNQFLKMTTKMSSAKNMRKFLGGIQLHLEAEGFRINVFPETNKIFRNGKLLPSFYFDMDQFGLALEFINQVKE
mgnify:CR=1 FL=1|tara:strand:- start:1437 stop:1706 length:270 start_codon:yes stop_codon:yes gene_type:complete